MLLASYVSSHLLKRAWGYAHELTGFRKSSSSPRRWPEGPDRKSCACARLPGGGGGGDVAMGEGGGLTKVCKTVWRVGHPHAVYAASRGCVVGTGTWGGMCEHEGGSELPQTQTPQCSQGLHIKSLQRPCRAGHLAGPCRPLPLDRGPPPQSLHPGPNEDAPKQGAARILSLPFRKQAAAGCRQAHKPSRLSFRESMSNTKPL